MRERPILFSGEMVRAILDGRKTQTRRVIPERSLARVMPHPHEAFFIDLAGDNPYGRRGDRLWVRETFALPLLENCNRSDRTIPQLVFAADGANSHGARWRPSIHMPRWASRIMLEITGVRVERLQAITAAGALAEGVQASDRASETDAFHNLWDALNAKRGYGWDQNPWVWVLEFRRVA